LNDNFTLNYVFAGMSRALMPSFRNLVAFKLVVGVGEHQTETNGIARFSCDSTILVVSVFIMTVDRYICEAKYAVYFQCLANKKRVIKNECILERVCNLDNDILGFFPPVNVKLMFRAKNWGLPENRKSTANHRKSA